MQDFIQDHESVRQDMGKDWLWKDKWKGTLSVTMSYSISCSYGSVILMYTMMPRFKFYLYYTGIMYKH